MLVIFTSNLQYINPEEHDNCHVAKERCAKTPNVFPLIFQAAVS
jgi:hypothetical protein